MEDPAMRRISLAVIGVLALVFLAAQPLAAGPRSGSAKLTFHQYGVPTTQVSPGDPFEVRGAGFRATFPVSVCFSGDHCLLTEVDATGCFVQSRSMSAAGLYTVAASQPRNRQLESWLQKAVAQITISN
jgi:hypothetical protein